MTDGDRRSGAYPLPVFQTVAPDAIPTSKAARIARAVEAARRRRVELGLPPDADDGDYDPSVWKKARKRKGK